jgi:hypothetical protein
MGRAGRACLNSQLAPIKQMLIYARWPYRLGGMVNRSQWQQLGLVFTYLPAVQALQH